jgi:hypothetical protein
VAWAPFFVCAALHKAFATRVRVSKTAEPDLSSDERQFRYLQNEAFCGAQGMAVRGRLAKINCGCLIENGDARATFCDPCVAWNDDGG